MGRLQAIVGKVNRLQTHPGSIEMGEYEFK